MIHKYLLVVNNRMFLASETPFLRCNKLPPSGPVAFLKWKKRWPQFGSASNPLQFSHFLLHSLISFSLFQLKNRKDWGVRSVGTRNMCAPCELTLIRVENQPAQRCFEFFALDYLSSISFAFNEKRHSKSNFRSRRQTTKVLIESTCN